MRESATGVSPFAASTNQSPRFDPVFPKSRAVPPPAAISASSETNTGGSPFSTSGRHFSATALAVFEGMNVTSSPMRVQLPASEASSQNAGVPTASG